MRIAHLIPSEKESSYTILYDPARGGVEAVQEISRGKSLKSFRRVVSANSSRCAMSIEAIMEPNSSASGQEVLWPAGKGNR